MRLVEMGNVLAKCAAFDHRTVGEADILAWFEAVGHLDYQLAMEAVSRFYARSKQRMWPIDLVEAVQAITAERSRGQHPVLSQPSRFEPDGIRDARVRAGVRQVSKALGLPRNEEADDVHQRALERARAERRQARTAAPRRRGPSRPLELEAVTRAPVWAREDMREMLSDAALHDRGRPCGRPGCGNPRCQVSSVE